MGMAFTIDMGMGVVLAKSVTFLYSHALTNKANLRFLFLPKLEKHHCNAKHTITHLE